MGWARFDDQVSDHPKVITLTDGAHRLWFDSIIYCSRYPALKGCLSRAQLSHVGRNVRARKKHERCIIDAGLWDVTDDGIAIHDFEDYGPAEKEPKQISKVRSEAGKKGAAARWAPEPSEDDGKSHMANDGKNGTRPVPSRPVPKQTLPVELAPDEFDGPLFDATPSPKPTKISVQVAEVYAHYRTHRPKILPTLKAKSKEWGKVRDRLEEGFSVAQLCHAIDGYFVSPYHCGKNDNGTKYQGLELIMRTKTMVENGWTYLEAAQPAPSGPPKALPDHAELEALCAKFGVSVLGPQLCAEVLGIMGNIAGAEKLIRRLTEDGLETCSATKLMAAVRAR